MSQEFIQYYLEGDLYRAFSSSKEEPREPWQRTLHHYQDALCWGESREIFLQAQALISQLPSYLVSTLLLFSHFSSPMCTLPFSLRCASHLPLRVAVLLSQCDVERLEDFKRKVISVAELFAVANNANSTKEGLRVLAVEELFPDPKSGRVLHADSGCRQRTYEYVVPLSSNIWVVVTEEVDKAAPQVQAVLQWLQANYTLEENPAMGLQGLFYYYHTMAKALTLYEMDRLALADGRMIDWRSELVDKLSDLQLEDGSWLNDNGRWWERDPALVTSYVVLTLERIHHSLK